MVDNTSAINIAPLTLKVSTRNCDRHARMFKDSTRLSFTRLFKLTFFSFVSTARWWLQVTARWFRGVADDSMQLRVRILNVSWVLNLSGFTFSIRNKRKHIQHVPLLLSPSTCAHVVDSPTVALYVMISDDVWSIVRASKHKFNEEIL